MAFWELEIAGIFWIHLLALVARYLKGGVMGSGRHG
jgi:hypothetical protein